MPQTTDRLLPLTRRTLGLAALASSITRPAAALVMPPQRQVTCKVVRKGVDIGRAVYSFDHVGDRLTVQMSVNISVRVGFIPLFHYDYQNTETWAGDQLLAFNARTLRNGSAVYAQGSWNGTALAVIGSATKPYAAPAGAIDTSYWNMRTVTDRLIDSQTGKLLNVAVADLGASAAVLASGASVPARQYRITGDLRVTLWYDDTQHLAGMEYYAHDGSVLTYEKI